MAEGMGGAWLAAQVVDQFRDEGFLNEKIAAQALAALAGKTLPRDFAWLLARHLAGNLPARRGRRRDPFAYSKVRVMRRRYREMRAAGEKYEVAIAELASRSGVPRKTVEAWIHPKN
jgi:hypothetical protein